MSACILVCVCVRWGVCAAAIYLKNYIRRLWDLDESEGGVCAADRLLLKQQLLLLQQQQQQQQQPAGVRAQLADCLRLVAAADFPLEWEELLPSLLQQLQLPHPQQLLQQQMQPIPPEQQQQLLQQLCCCLTTVHALTKKYRQTPRAEEVLLQLQQILNQLQEPLLSAYIFSVQQVLLLQQQQQQQQAPNTGAAAAAAADRLDAALLAATLCIKIFISLSSVDLPEYLEDNLSVFVSGFLQLLQLPVHLSSSNSSNEADAADDDDDTDRRA